MKSIEDLNRLVGLLIHHHLPKEQTLWMGIEEYNETNRFLRNLGSSGVLSVKLDGTIPKLECIRIIYGGYTFNIVNY